MKRLQYLSEYHFDWETMDTFLEGRSTLDSSHFFQNISTHKQARRFLRGYGFDPNDPVLMSELFGNFQESLQFIKKYFLKEGSEIGLDVRIPSSILAISDIQDLLIMASVKENETEQQIEERLWAEIIIKVLHTILHTDKELRSNYFPYIQKQILDRFYRHIHRDSEDRLFLTKKLKLDDAVALVDFKVKAKKPRDSVILKLLHKADNVAEELFDRVGIRFVTKSPLDNLRVIKFLYKHNIVIPHNIKPSRSFNRIFDLDKFKKQYEQLNKKAVELQMEEPKYFEELNKISNECSIINDSDLRNLHTSKSYRSIQFTGRQFIRYKNPLFEELYELKKQARESSDQFAQKVLAIDFSGMQREIRFFYPFEVQVVDEQNEIMNTQGEASHLEYKKSQQITAMKRIFKELISFKNLKVD